MVNCENDGFHGQQLYPQYDDSNERCCDHSPSPSFAARQRKRLLERKLEKSFRGLERQNIQAPSDESPQEHAGLRNENNKQLHEHTKLPEDQEEQTNVMKRQNLLQQDESCRFKLKRSMLKSSRSIACSSTVVVPPPPALNNPVRSSSSTNYNNMQAQQPNSIQIPPPPTTRPKHHCLDDSNCNKLQQKQEHAAIPPLTPPPPPFTNTASISSESIPTPKATNRSSIIEQGDETLSNYNQQQQQQQETVENDAEINKAQSYNRQMYINRNDEKGNVNLEPHDNDYEIKSPRAPTKRFMSVVVPLKESAPPAHTRRTASAAPVSFRAHSKVSGIHPTRLSQRKPSIDSLSSKKSFRSLSSCGEGSTDSRPGAYSVSSRKQSIVRVREKSSRSLSHQANLADQGEQDKEMERQRRRERRAMSKINTETVHEDTIDESELEDVVGDIIVSTPRHQSDNQSEGRKPDAIIPLTGEPKRMMSLEVEKGYSGSDKSDAAQLKRNVSLDLQRFRNNRSESKRNVPVDFKSLYGIKSSRSLYSSSSSDDSTAAPGAFAVSNEGRSSSGRRQRWREKAANSTLERKDRSADAEGGVDSWGAQQRSSSLADHEENSSVPRLKRNPSLDVNSLHSKKSSHSIYSCGNSTSTPGAYSVSSLGRSSSRHLGLASLEKSKKFSSKVLDSEKRMVREESSLEFSDEGKLRLKQLQYRESSSVLQEADDVEGGDEFGSASVSKPDDDSFHSQVSGFGLESDDDMDNDYGEIIDNECMSRIAAERRKSGDWVDPFDLEEKEGNDKDMEQPSNQVEQHPGKRSPKLLVGELPTSHRSISTQGTRREQRATSTISSQASLRDISTATTKSTGGSCTYCICIGAIFFFLVVVGVVCGFAFGLRGRKNPSSSDESTDGIIPPIETFGDLMQQCTLKDDLNESQVSEVLLAQIRVAKEQLDLDGATNFSSTINPCSSSTFSLLSIPSQISGSTATVDRFILSSFYFATEGWNWKNNSFWVSNQDFCAWYGITCNEGGEVMSINLTSNSLKGTLPEDLYALTSLEILSLVDNDIHGSLSMGIGNLEKLVLLDLEETQLEGTLPSELGNLPQLRHILVSSDRVTGPLPSTLGMPQLETLKIGSSSNVGEIPSEIARGASSLVDLHLRGPFVGRFPDEFWEITSLKHLRLDSGLLEGSLKFGNNSNWESIDISGGNMFKGSIPNEIGLLQNLSVFHVVLNFLTGTLPSALGKCKNLTSLNLSGNEISGTIPTEIGRLTDLGSLALDLNKIRGSIPVEISKLAKLERLWLYGDFTECKGSRCGGITGTFPTEFCQISSLSSIILTCPSDVFNSCPEGCCECGPIGR